MSTNKNATAAGPPLHPQGRAASGTGVTAGTRSQSASGSSVASGTRSQSTSGSTSGVASGSAQSAQSVQSMQSAAEQIPPHGYPSSLKLPTFWITRPELWFIQVESAFRNRHPPVTSDIVKFDCVIGALPNKVPE